MKKAIVWVCLFLNTIQLAYPFGGGNGETQLPPTVCYPDTDHPRPNGNFPCRQTPVAPAQGNDNSLGSFAEFPLQDQQLDRAAMDESMRRYFQNEIQGAMYRQQCFGKTIDMFCQMLQTIQKENEERLAAEAAEKALQEYRQNYGYYSFETPKNSPHYAKLTASYRELNRLQVPPDSKRAMAKEYGLVAYQASDHAHADPEAQNSYYELGKALADIALGIDAVTGFARGLYELTTGQNIITGEHLTLFDRSMAAIAVLSAGTFSSATKAAQATKNIVIATARKFGGAIAHNTGQIVEAIDKAVGPHSFYRAASTLRKTPGVSSMSAALHEPRQLLRGTHANAAQVPKSIGEALSGREFRTFGELRRAFWQQMANHPQYAQEFAALHPDNLDLMRRGLSPIAEATQHVGANRVFELHHLKNIQHGGEVYDLSNLVIVSPRYHSRVFHQ